MANTIIYPFGKATEEMWEYVDNKVEGTIKNQLSYIMVDTGLTGNTTLNLTISDRLQQGAEFYFSCDGVSGSTTEHTLTLGTKVTGVNPTVDNGATSPEQRILKFFYDGNEFILVQDTIQKAAV